MNNRNYNLFFHLHTVSGITITVGLFIIFFGGAFALFREEISEWETGKYHKTGTVGNQTEKTDYNRILDSIEKRVPSLYGRNIYVYSQGTSQKQTVYVSESDEQTDSLGMISYNFKVDPKSYALKSYESEFSFGELLYMLHFYYQLDNIGYYISGLVALFFFLAIVTGILVHWQKVKSHFFVFRPRQKMKTVWTDAHTALGVIGLPFQFIYALTGSMFGLGIVVASSNGLWFYDGDPDKMYDDIRRESTADADTLGTKETYVVDYNHMVSETKQKWPDFNVTNLYIEFYGSKTMQVEVSGAEHIKERFLGQGSVVYSAATGKEKYLHVPGKMGYYDNVWSSVRRLHYAQFGEIGSFGTYFLKTIYFLMAFLTCFVIISGVLIWLEARNKKNIPEKKRRYNERVGSIYLATCLSMLPVTAAGFILSKVLPASLAESRESILNVAFFLGWLILSIFLAWKKDKHFTNQFTLISAGILGLLIPFVNGFSSGNWFWRTFANEEYGIFSVDFVWLCIGIICLLIVRKLTKKVPTEAGT